MYLLDDTNNDNSLTQWFFFAMRNVKKDTVVRINIKNLMKDDSLYSMGMKPFVFSVKKKADQGVTWHRGGYNIEYAANGQTIRTSSKTVSVY